MRTWTPAPSIFPSLTPPHSGAPSLRDHFAGSRMAQVEGASWSCSSAKFMLSRLVPWLGAVPAAAGWWRAAAAAAAAQSQNSDDAMSSTIGEGSGCVW